MKFDPKTKRQILIFILAIDGLYELGVISGFLSTFNNLFAGVSAVMILGLASLYFAYLVYTGDI